MRIKVFSNVEKLLSALVVTAALLYIAVYVGVAIVRLNYPFALEWMEGGSLEHVHRILSGHRLYVSPSVKFTPYIYPPLYFYASAFFARIMGENFLPLRLLSFAASCGSFTLIGLLVVYETQDRCAGILASGLFAATFECSGAWFDLARVDSLFLFLTLCGVYCLKTRQSIASKILAGFCLSFAFFTKQTAIVIFLPLLIYLGLKERRHALWLLATCLIGMGGMFIFLNTLHHGWYWYYIFDLPGQHSLVANMFILFWSRDILLPLAIASCFGIFYIGKELYTAPLETGIFYLLLGIGMFGGAWGSRMHSGSYYNTLFPAHAFLSILFGIASHVLYQLVSSRWSGMQQILLKIFISFICLIQFAVLLYNPFDYCPTQQDRKAGFQILSIISQIPGEVFIPRHGYLALLAGKKSFAQEMAIADILRGHPHHRAAITVKDRLQNEMQESVHSHTFQAIISDYERTNELSQNYGTAISLFTSKTVFWPVSGVKTRPEYLYLAYDAPGIQLP